MEEEVTRVIEAKRENFLAWAKARAETSNEVTDTILADYWMRNLDAAYWATRTYNGTVRVFPEPPRTRKGPTSAAATASGF
jgi:hypothetical protein